MKIEKEWKELQDIRWKEYLSGVTGFFNTGGKGVDLVRKTIDQTINGRCLDVGCGVLPLPPYMETHFIQWYGIDPLEGNTERSFPFKQACAEDMPFKDEFFNGVLFSTSLDHVKDPVVAISEAYRVLKPGGYLFIWGGICPNDKKYKKWLYGPQPAFYDKHHMWAFTNLSILILTYKFTLIKRIAFRRKIMHCIKGFNIQETIFIFKKP